MPTMDGLTRHVVLVGKNTQKAYREVNINVQHRHLAKKMADNKQVMNDDCLDAHQYLLIELK